MRSGWNGGAERFFAIDRSNEYAAILCVARCDSINPRIHCEARHTRHNRQVKGNAMRDTSERQTRRVTSCTYPAYKGACCSWHMWFRGCVVVVVHEAAVVWRVVDSLCVHRERRGRVVATMQGVCVASGWTVCSCCGAVREDACNDERRADVVCWLNKEWFRVAVAAHGMVRREATTKRVERECIDSEAAAAVLTL